MESACVLHPSSYRGVSGVSSVSSVSSIPNRAPVMESASILHPSSSQGVRGVSSINSIPDRVPVMGPASTLHPSSYRDDSGVSSGSIVSPRNEVNGGSGGTEAFSPEIHVYHLQLMHEAQQFSCEEMEFLDDMIRAEEEAGGETAWMLDYSHRNRHNRCHSRRAERLSSQGELNIVLSPMALSSLYKWEYERMEALAEEGKWDTGKVCQSSLNYGCVMSHCVFGTPVR